jgi:hypothetical protein
MKSIDLPAPGRHHTCYPTSLDNLQEDNDFWQCELLFLTTHNNRQYFPRLQEPKPAPGAFLKGWAGHGGTEPDISARKDPEHHGSK